MLPIMVASQRLLCAGTLSWSPTVALTAVAFTRDTDALRRASVMFRAQLTATIAVFLFYWPTCCLARVSAFPQPFRSITWARIVRSEV